MYVKICQKLVAGCSLLQNDDYRLKRSAGHKLCVSCDLGCKDDVYHLVMQCPASQVMRDKMFKELEDLDNETVKSILVNPQNVFKALMGSVDQHESFDDQMELWKISGSYICKKYSSSVAYRLGIG